MIPTYRKTVAGVEEVERHTMRLRPELRRLLIMIDGRRSVDSLVAFFRADDLPRLLDELMQCGAIEAAVAATGFLPSGAGVSGAATAGAATAASGATHSALTQAQLLAAINVAKAFTKAKLGRGADRFVDALDRCPDSKVLRVVLSDIQLKLIGEHDEEEATALVRAVREAVRLAG